jgi:two-component system, NarL family, sensor histidine kinase UhpB
VTPATRDLALECEAAVSAHLAHASEATLLEAYEVARRAMVAGTGIVEVAALLGASLGKALRERGLGEAGLADVAAAHALMVEMLSPFEMSYRGAREANDALRRMNELREEEIRRIAHELHDSAGQMLATAMLAVDRAATAPPPEREAALAEARELLRATDRALRRLAHETRPTALEDLGIGAALRLLCDGLAQRSGIAIELRTDTGARPGAAVETALYRITQEAIRNAMKHANPSAIVVTLRVDGSTFDLSVRDDGAGFDPAVSPAGLGLVGIRERVASLDGTLHIESHRGTGTELTVSIPREAPYAVPHSAGG